MPRISVVVTTYNHEGYIAQCLDSIVSHQGDFLLEIIVGDDASTDGTRTIVQVRRDRHPELIRILPRQDDLGITKNLKRCLDACKGEYIAICGGSDYWTAVNKLRKQSEVLEEIPDSNRP